MLENHDCFGFFGSAQKQRKAMFYGITTHGALVFRKNMRYSMYPNRTQNEEVGIKKGCYKKSVSRLQLELNPRGGGDGNHDTLT